MLKLEMLETGNINDSVDYNVRDMHSLGTKFSCQRLRQCAKSKFATCKTGEVGRALDTGRCPCVIRQKAILEILRY